MNSQMSEKLVIRFRHFLNRELPALSDYWWDDYVMPKINGWRQRELEYLGPQILYKLDLAEILRVAEGAWREIARNNHFPTRVFTLIKSLQVARNDYAHRTWEDDHTEDWHRYDCFVVDLLFSYIDESGDSYLIPQDAS